jgi:hypothetical protein
VTPPANDTIITPPDEPEKDYTLVMLAIFGLLALSAITIIAGVIYWKKDKEIITFAKKIRYKIKGIIEDFKAGRLKLPAPKPKPKKEAPKPQPQEKAPEPELEEKPKKNDKSGMIETATGFQEADSLDSIGDEAGR